MTNDKPSGEASDLMVLLVPIGDIAAKLDYAAWEKYMRAHKSAEALIARNAELEAERDAYRLILKDFQDGRKISNPHTRQVARDIEQQAIALALTPAVGKKP
jgi:hypothetical protein